MGFNATIPEFVKYKMGSETLYIPTIGYDGAQTTLLTEISAGTKVYSSNSFDDAYDTGMTVTNTRGLFTYGTTNASYGTTATLSGAWTVPATVTVNGNDYKFAGHNMTIIPRAALTFVNNTSLMQNLYFCQESSMTNIWSASPIRTWLNSEESQPLPYGTVFTSTGMLGRLYDKKFKAAIIPVVNRTFLNQTSKPSNAIQDDNNCQHVVDRFWLLGCGNLNCTGMPDATELSLPDAKFDTSIFSGVFRTSTAISIANNDRVFSYYNANGTINGTKIGIWTRSCHQFHPYSNSTIYSMGFVSSTGQVWTNSVRSSPFYILPACTIG